MNNQKHSLAQVKTSLRSPAQVMDLNRLGSFYPYKLSFMRKLMRKVMQEQWSINCVLFNFDIQI